MMLWTVDRSDPRQLPQLSPCVWLRDEVGWNGMDSASVLFGWEAEWSEDVPDTNIHVRCGATPSPKISRTGSVPGGTSGSWRCWTRTGSWRGAVPDATQRRRGERSRAGRGGEEERRAAPDAKEKRREEPRAQVNPTPPSRGEALAGERGGDPAGHRRTGKRAAEIRPAATAGELRPLPYGGTGERASKQWPLLSAGERASEQQPRRRRRAGEAQLRPRHGAVTRNKMHAYVGKRRKEEEEDEANGWIPHVIRLIPLLMC
jgi:hypothetical protein